MQTIPCRQFTDDFKAQAVTLAETIGPAKAARQLDISVKTLANWLAASRSGQPLSSPTRLPVGARAAPLRAPRNEAVALRQVATLSGRPPVLCDRRKTSPYLSLIASALRPTPPSSFNPGCGSLGARGRVGAGRQPETARACQKF